MILLYFGGVVNAALQWCSNPNPSWVHFLVITFNDISYLLTVMHEMYHHEVRMINPVTSMLVWGAQLAVIFIVLPADMWCLVEGAHLRRRRRGIVVPEFAGA